MHFVQLECVLQCRIVAVRNWLCVLRVNASNSINEQVFSVRSNKRLEHANPAKKSSPQIVGSVNRSCTLTHPLCAILIILNGHLGFSNPSINFISFIVEALKKKRAHIYASIADNKNFSFNDKKTLMVIEAIVWNNSIAYICAQLKKYHIHLHVSSRHMRSENWKPDGRKKLKSLENISRKSDRVANEIVLQSL